MPNILFSYLYRLKFYSYGSACGYDIYKHCFDMSLDTFQKNLLHLDDIKIVGHDVNDANEMCHDLVDELRSFHKKYKCNLLFIGPDVLCQKRTDIFGKYDYFKMFYATKINASGLKNDKYYPLAYCGNYNKTVAGFPYLFNSGPTYIPSELCIGIWDYCDYLLSSNYFVDGWGWEQSLFNTLFYKQKIVQESNNIADLLEPRLGFQYTYSDLIYNTNKITLEDANIVHFHLSREKRYSILEHNYNLIMNNFFEPKNVV